MIMSDIVKMFQDSPGFCSLKGSSNEAVDQAEETLQLKFAVEYREYLAAFGVATIYGHEFTGICTFPRLNVIDVTIFERLNNPFIPVDWYVVEQANIDDIVIWQSRTGEVYQSNPSTAPIKLSNSLSEYISL